MISRAASLFGAASNTARPWAAHFGKQHALVHRDRQNRHLELGQGAGNVAADRRVCDFTIDHKCDFEVFLKLLSLAHQLHGLGRGPHVIRRGLDRNQNHVAAMMAERPSSFTRGAPSITVT